MVYQLARFHFHHITSYGQDYEFDPILGQVIRLFPARSEAMGHVVQVMYEAALRHNAIRPTLKLFVKSFVFPALNSLAISNKLKRLSTRIVQIKRHYSDNRKEEDELCRRAKRTCI